jgi:hypothetical protein
MNWPKRFLTTILLTAVAVRSAGAQVAGEVVFDPATQQYLSFSADPSQQAAEPEPLPGFLEGVCPTDDPSWWGPDWIRRFSIFAGVHGFRGPLDLGNGGNFGFHEGVNFGAPFYPPWGFGFQLGVQAAHSNFQGNPILGEQGPRTQLFATGGFFHRSEGFGLVSGVVFDYFHDEYYDDVDLMQIRSENALRLGPWREFGYWGAYNVSSDLIRLPNRLTQPLAPQDLFSLFYRRHFSGGGQGRVWAGMSGNGDYYLGAEGTVPMGTNWALENNFAYLIPKKDVAGVPSNEVWAVSIRLVWYPGRPSRCIFVDNWQPMLGVADNSVFLVKRK